MKKILLTGSEGFVGRNLHEALSRRDDFVLCAPRQSEINLTDSNDVAQCIEAFQPDSKAAPGSVYNIASPYPVSI